MLTLKSQHYLLTAFGSWGEAAHNTAGSLDCYFPLSQCCKSFYPHLSDSIHRYLLLSFPTTENALFHTKGNYFADWHGALGQCCQSWGTSSLGAGVKSAEELGWQGLPFALLGGNNMPCFEAGCAEAPRRVQLQRSALHLGYLPLAATWNKNNNDLTHMWRI